MSRPSTKTGAPDAAASAATAIGLLPFVAEGPRGKGRNFWTIKARTGDRELDRCLGREFGRQAIVVIRQYDCECLLRWVISDMMKAGTYDGVELGFIEKFEAAVMGR